MTGHVRDTPEFEARLDEILGAYLRAVDGGLRPNRSAIFADHPEFAQELRDFFADQDRFDHMASPLQPFAGASWDGTTLIGGYDESSLRSGLPGRLGDYEILEELAHGGMGVVYKCRQRGLNRVVALKMIRSGHCASPADRQRFRNEAEAVANLDHPAIVPVYEVGEHDSALYFTMKLMEGGPLTAKLPSLMADPKRAARLMIDIARAIHHAHQHGILHRDLKPSNILLDAHGRPYVTDFGLLKHINRDGSAELTGTGDIVGTPGYMSPEQAIGARGGITTACDVYGLGAIFYTMLTGQAPFHAETALDTILQVRQREPVSPRRLNPRIDRDLEMICLKCLEKDAQRRYPSAEALANELERYLEGRSLMLTRPVGATERAWRWCRRNRAAAAVIAAVALAVVVVAAVSTVAALSLKLANDKERASRARAEQNRDLALQAVNTFFTRVSQNRQLKARGLEKFRKDLLSQAREFTEQLVQVQTDEPKLQVELANAYLGLGQITELLGARLDALADYQRAKQIFESLLTELPENLEACKGLGSALLQQGNIEQFNGRATEALCDYQKALAIWQDLAGKNPDSPEIQEELNKVVFQTARQYQLTNQLAQAEDLYRTILPFFEQLKRDHARNPRYLSSLAKVYHNLGDVYLEAANQGATEKGKNLAAALTNFEKAQSFGQAALDLQPDDVDYQDALAQACHHLGLCQSRLGHPKLAEPAYRNARSLRKRLAEEHLDVPEYQFKLSTVLHGLGGLYMHDKNRRPEAGPIFEEALALFAKVADDFPDDMAVRRQAAVLPYDAACCYALAVVDHLPGDRETARAMELLRQANAAKFFGIPDPIKTLENDEDLDSIRERTVFQAFLRDLKQSAP